ncbi:MAG: putative oxygen-independent coproporphyrinogen oxidase [Actinomycetia bacterium]|nr:putative oxygen-independent coproporphyrinogen oxidase [Actinomycetes bacterium]
MFGVYVHVPFCAHRCDYCDFATWTDRAHLIDEYVDACVEDLQRRVANGQPDAASVFFGGGTPSLLEADKLVRILDAIPRTAGAEVTVECNPDSVDAAKFAAYRRGGVTRLSFGVQSMRPHVLAALGRTHDPANVQRAVALARDAGFAHVSIDLIYGTPGETMDDWRATLDSAIALGVDHISAYALTVEPATPLGLAVAAGERPAPDDDDQADKYAFADDTLSAAGFEWYEVSNWALPGHECRHNRCYWDGSEYVGIGAAAHGFTGGRRWWNTRTPERYIARIADGPDAVTGDEVLAPAARVEEAFGLALRTRSGATVGRAAAPVIGQLASAGLLTVEEDRIVLTRPGRLLASDLTARLLLAGAPG